MQTRSTCASVSNVDRSAAIVARSGTAVPPRLDVRRHGPFIRSLYRHETGAYTSEVHARHNGLANGWFLDGHAERVGFKRTVRERDSGAPLDELWNIRPKRK